MSHMLVFFSIFYFFVVRGLERENEKNKTNKRRERNAASWLRRKKDQKFERKLVRPPTRRRARQILKHSLSSTMMMID